MRNSLKLKIFNPKKKAPDNRQVCLNKSGRVVTRQYANHDPKLSKKKIEEFIIGAHAYCREMIDRLVSEKDLVDYAKDFCESDAAIVAVGMQGNKRK